VFEVIGRAAPGWLWAFRALRGQSPVLFRTSEDVGYDVPLLLLLLALIHRSAWNRNSATFAELRYGELRRDQGSGS
jgi:hypothetical protein